MTQMTWLAALAGLLLMIHGGVAADDRLADGSYLSPVPLKGIQTVAIHIDRPRQQYDHRGFDIDKLYAAVRQKLEAAGLRVIEPHEVETEAHAAVLNLRIRVNEGAYYYAYGLSLSLQRKFDINDLGYTTLRAWSDSRVGALRPGEFPRLSHQSLDMVDQFLAIHQQHNPA